MKPHLHMDRIMDYEGHKLRVERIIAHKKRLDQDCSLQELRKKHSISLDFRRNAEKSQINKQNSKIFHMILSIGQRKNRYQAQNEPPRWKGQFSRRKESVERENQSIAKRILQKKGFYGQINKGVGEYNRLRQRLLRNRTELRKVHKEEK